MKRNSIILVIIAFFAGITFHANAQSPYKHGIGATVGTSQAVTYKTFPTQHFAIQVDLGTKYCYVYGSHLWSLDLSPNFMYEGRLCKGLYGFVGLGGSLGYNWQPFSYITGLEPGDPGYDPIPDPTNPNQNSATIWSVHNCKAGARRERFLRTGVQVRHPARPATRLPSRLPLHLPPKQIRRPQVRLGAELRGAVHVVSCGVWHSGKHIFARPITGRASLLGIIHHSLITNHN